tara:strand:- start:36 stop:1655 length:1620 start_codon:yes stop_codon:yes gene_type:complete
MAVGPGLHVDSQGNLHIGSTRETFDSTTISEAPFSVTKAGVLNATSGSYSGNITGGSIDIGGSDASSFHVDTDGNMFLGAGTIGSAPFKVSNAGAVTATSGSIGGNTLGSTFIESSNYNTGTAGWRINSDGTAEFESVEIRVAASGESSEDDIPPGAQSILVGAIPIYDFNGNFNIHPASGKSVIIHNGNPFVIKGETGTAQMKFEGAGSVGDFLIDLDFVSYSTAQSDSTRRYSNPSPLTQIREFFLENENTQIFRANEQNADIEFFGDIGVGSNAFLYINGDNGSSGEVLKRTATGMEWASAGGSHSDSDHTSFVDHVDTSTGGDGGTDALTISNGGIALNFGTTGTRVAVGNHTHDGMVGTGITQINSPSVGFFSGYTFNTSTGAFSVSTSNTNSSSTTVGNLFPNTTGSDLGHPFGNGEWDRLYIQNNPNVSSDERKKENIEDLSYGLDYIKTLAPKSYTLISDENSKVHWGFIAQQLLETPPEPDLDIAFVDYQEEHDHYSVAYAELIAPLVKAVQELSAKNDELELRLAALEG